MKCHAIIGGDSEPEECLKSRKYMENMKKQLGSGRLPSTTLPCGGIAKHYKNTLKCEDCDCVIGSEGKPEDCRLDTDMWLVEKALKK